MININFHLQDLTAKKQQRIWAVFFDTNQFYFTSRLE